MTTDQAARFIGSIPHNYDNDLVPHIFSGYAADLAGRVAELRPATLLELAAGTGVLTRKLHDALAGECALTASDLNVPMLDVAKEKFGPDESVRFEQIDATDLSFADSSFDIVTCQFGVVFFPDKDRAYAEVHRVLAPGGHYLFNVWGSWEANPFAQVAHRVVAGFFPEDPPGFYKVPFGYHDADEISESLRRAGFSDVTVTALPLKSTILSPARLANGLVFGNPVQEEVAARGGDPHAVCAALADAIEGQLGSELVLQAMVVQASKV